MKLLDDLYKELSSRTNCNNCDFYSFCCEGVNGTYNINGDDYNLCEILKMAKESKDKK